MFGAKHEVASSPPPGSSGQHGAVSAPTNGVFTLRRPEIFLTSHDLYGETDEVDSPGWNCHSLAHRPQIGCILAEPKRVRLP